jgi:hypothetical protein
MQKTKLAVLAALGLLQTKALITKNGQKYFSKSRSEAEYVSEIQERMSKSNSLNPQTFWFNATIDHYDNNGAGSATYPMRYLVDRTYFNE